MTDRELARLFLAALVEAMKSDSSPAVRKKAGWYAPGGSIYRRTTPKKVARSTKGSPVHGAGVKPKALVLNGAVAPLADRSFESYANRTWTIFAAFRSW